VVVVIFLDGRGKVSYEGIIMSSDLEVPVTAVVYKEDKS